MFRVYDEGTVAPIVVDRSKILLVLVDGPDPAVSLEQLQMLCARHEFTIVLAWSWVRVSGGGGRVWEERQVGA